jgi:hypothetical protein
MLPLESVTTLEKQRAMPAASRPQTCRANTLPQRSIGPACSAEAGVERAGTNARAITAAHLRNCMIPLHKSPESAKTLKQKGKKSTKACAQVGLGCSIHRLKAAFHR